MRQLFIPIIIFFIGCTAPTTTDTHQTQAEESKAVVFSKNVYLINNGGCVYKDSIVVDSIGNNLFMDKKGKVYFKTYDQSERGSKLPVLISRLYNGCEGDSTYDLARNIDIKSFSSLGMDYYKDKNKVVIHNEMIDGGNIGIISEADCKSFKVIPNSFYAIDKKDVYYKGERMDKADPKTFHGIYKYTSSDTICFFGQDRKNYYDGETICTKDKIDEYLKE